MGTIYVAQFISLDGVIEAPETWHFPYISDDAQAEITKQIMEQGAMLLGRVTYDAFAGYWPKATDEETGGIAGKFNRMPKYVVSSTLAKADWQNTTIIKDNVVEALRRVKQQVKGRIGITGSATLVQSLIPTNLIDEYQLMVHPIVVGHGKRLFNDGDHAKLKLVGSKTFSGGIIHLTYEPDRSA